MNLTAIYNEFSDAVGSVQINPIPNRRKRIVHVVKWVGTHPVSVTVEPDAQSGKRSISGAVADMKTKLGRAFPGIEF